MQKDKKIAKSPNKSQASISPSNGYKDKFQKIGKFHGMKNSFTNDHEKKKDFQFHAPTTPEIKPQHKKQKNKDKQKE